MFPEDMGAQHRKLAQMLTAAVKGLDHLNRLVPVVQDLGRRHARYGVTDAHYDTVGGRVSIAAMGSSTRSEARLAHDIVPRVLKHVVADR